MLELSWSEILFVLVIALLVLGPQELSRAAFMLGNFVGRARDAFGDMRNAFEDMSEELESERPKIKEDKKDDE